MKYSLLLSQGGQENLCVGSISLSSVFREQEGHTSLNVTMSCICPVGTVTNTISLDLYHLSLIHATRHPCHLSLIHSLQRSELKLESLCWLLGGQHTSGLQAHGSCLSHSSFGKLSLTFRCSAVFGFNHVQWELSDDFMYLSTSRYAP